MTDVLYNLFVTQIKAAIAFYYKRLASTVVAKVFVTIDFDFTLTADDFDTLRGISAEVVLFNATVAGKDNP